MTPADINQWWLGRLPNRAFRDLAIDLMHRHDAAVSQRDELLAACEALLAERAQTDAIYEDAYHFVFKGQGARLWESLRAAIAKARGGK
jgi:hypothetical protein